MGGTGFNIQAFLAYLGEDRDLAMELLAAFVEDAPVRLRSLIEAAGSGDADAAVRAAHSLKGMCGVIRDQEATAQALDLEMAGRRGDVAALRAGLPALEQSLARILERARAFLAA